MLNYLIKIHAISGPILFILVSTVLGVLSPEYSLSRHTLSRLLIHKYGTYQMINFFQFGLSLLATGVLLSQNLSVTKSKKTIRIIFGAAAILSFLVAILTPTDIDNFRDVFTNPRSTATSVMHVLVVLLFVAAAPIIVHSMDKALSAEGHVRLALITKLMGYLGFIFSILWVVFYYNGWLWEYKGLMQKSLAVWVIVWIEILLLKTPKNRS